MSPPSFFSRLLGTSEAAPALSDGPAAGPAPQPAAEPAPRTTCGSASPAKPSTSADDPNAFVRREAILDRKERISGYEFSLRMGENSPLQRRSGVARRAYDGALLSRLGHLSIDNLLGLGLSFLRYSPPSLLV